MTPFPVGKEVKLVQGIHAEVWDAIVLAFVPKGIYIKKVCEDNKIDPNSLPRNARLTGQKDRYIIKRKDGYVTVALAGAVYSK